MFSPYSTLFKTSIVRDFCGRQDNYMVTFSPPYIHPLAIEEFHMKLMYYIIDKKFILFPEIDITGRFHYHGMMILPDIYKFKEDVEKEFAMFIDIQIIKNIDNWYNYMIKDYASNQQMFLRNRNVCLIKFSFDFIDRITKDVLLKALNNIN